MVASVVYFRYMSISRLEFFRIMRSRKLIHLLLSSVGLSFMFVCIWFMYLLMRLVFVRLVSYMINISSTYLVYKVIFFVSSSYFICMSSRCCRKIKKNITAVKKIRNEFKHAGIQCVMEKRWL
jgi:hypothetical protein